MEVLSRSEWPHCQILFLPLFLEGEESQLHWQEGERRKKERSDLASRAVLASPPSSQRFASHAIGLDQPLHPGTWADGCLGRAYRDGGFPCCVPMLQQGFGQLSLGNNLHKRKQKVEMLVI